jgi:uncharacterized repeat protein (TIGR02543 family)
VLVSALSSLDSGDTITKIFAGLNRSAAISQQGHVWTWGSLHQSLLGSTNNSYTNQITPLKVTDLFDLSQEETLTAMHFSLTMNIALTTENRLFTWGTNANGQLGNGSTLTSSGPLDMTEHIALNAGESIIDIQVGDEHGVIFTDEARAFRWGRNDIYQLGTGTVMNLNTPTLFVLDLEPDEVLKGIAAQYKNTFLWTSTHRVLGMGENTKNQFMDGTTQPKQLPTDITLTLNPHQNIIETLILAGNWSKPFQFIRFENHQIYGWGQNTESQLGTGREGIQLGLGFTSIHTPQPLTPLIEVSGRLIELDTPTLEGYIFTGWYKDIERTIPFEEVTMPEEDITLYAKFTVNE